jgi:hypothetical protein
LRDRKSSERDRSPSDQVNKIVRSSTGVASSIAALRMVTGHRRGLSGHAAAM